MRPALTLYLTEKYDLGCTSVPDNFVKVSFRKCLLTIAISNATVLDVPEPLWMRFALKNMLVMIIWKFFGFIFRKHRRIVTYAIENNTIENLLSPNREMPLICVRLFRFLYGLMLYKLIDKIAFGSSAAQRSYASMDFFTKVDSSLLEELPAACAELPLTLDRRDVRKAAFVGTLDDRKGVLDLMAAWKTVEVTVPDAVLKIVGHGQYATLVADWCLESPGSRSFVGFVENSEVRSHLTACSVLVAPSRRDGRWREQIGLPISEALSVGLTVVTTDETGLAEWLADNGHLVITEGNVDAELASSIVEALRQPLLRSSVIGSLPKIAGRIAADHWLQAENGSKNSSCKDSP